MSAHINWKRNFEKSQLNISAEFFISLVCLTCLIATSIQAQSDTTKLYIKNKNINGAPHSYLKIGGGAVYPCGERFSISLEDDTRFIFSAASGFNVTLSPNGVDFELGGTPFDPNSPKRTPESTTYDQAFDQIKSLQVGYTEGEFGQRWAIAPDQLKAVYPSNIFEVTYDDEERTTFDQSNLFYEMLMSIQVLAKQNEDQQNLIEQQTSTITMLDERLQQIENALNISAEFIPNKTFGEVNINPNPITNGTLQIDYQLNQNVSNANLIITDIQGKKVYESPLNNTQKKGNQNLTFHLPTGTYLYYLESGNQQTNAKKLMVL